MHTALPGHALCVCVCVCEVMKEHVCGLQAILGTAYVHNLKSAVPNGFSSNMLIEKEELHGHTTVGECINRGWAHTLTKPYKHM